MSPQGGIIHIYQGYDPVNLPGPRQTLPDVVSGAMEHLMRHGSLRRLTPEELARAVRLDPAQIRGLGPSLESLIALLEARRRKILATFDPTSAQRDAEQRYREDVAAAQPPLSLRERFEREARGGQLRDLESLWYAIGDERDPFAAELLRLVQRLGDRYQVEQLLSRYEFTGREPLTVAQALEVKQELERIDALLEQLRKALESAQLALIDMEELAAFAPPEELEGLRRLQAQMEGLLRDAAERQGLELTPDGYRLTPQAHRLFQSRLLATIFSDLVAAQHGRHEQAVEGEGSVELVSTRPYEFGDGAAALDLTQSVLNALARRAGAAPAAALAGDAHASGRRPISVMMDDLVVHRTRSTPRCATAVILDMSGSMRYDQQHVSGKRMALALEGLIRREYPGDFLQFIEMYSLAKPRSIGEIPALLPKPVAIHAPVVRLRADLSDPSITEMDIPQHFTNIQLALKLARQFLGAQQAANRQIVLITDGLPTAHVEGEHLYLLYPPHPRTEEATMREARRCGQEGIVINLFLLPSWSQSEEDVRFAHRMVEATRGRVFFTAGRDLDRFVVWDYVRRRKSIVG
jgi:uncharacterized protein with von Willebrand factor type A (vWA) domain